MPNIRKRNANIVSCRNMIFDYIDRFTKGTQEMFGVMYNKDHTTALHGMRMHRKLVGNGDKIECSYSEAFKYHLSLEKY